MPLKNNITSQKRHGVVYTPRWIVDEILERVISDGLRGKRLCDPACGDGNFLVAAAEKIINESDSLNNLEENLQNGICGFDSDANALYKCRTRLDSLLCARDISKKINWNLHCIDSVNYQQIAAHFGAFDFVVGNPPYIRIQNIPPQTRQTLSKHWQVAAHGCGDIYMAFFEIGINLLNTRGKLGYITPNGYTKTAAGKSLRELLANSGFVETLIDFGEEQIFADATTYSLITILNKQANDSLVELCRYDGKNINRCGKITRRRLYAPQWDLCNNTEYERLQKIRQRGLPLGEISNIHVGIQTLADDVFILRQVNDEGHFLLCQTVAGETIKIEKEATLPILKVSVMKNGSDPIKRIIICPYRKESLRIPQLISEKEMSARYPKTFAYLQTRKPRLLMRDKGECKSAWYAYGREMNLQKTLGDKILTSGMNVAPNFMKCPNPAYTFYSGYAIKIKNNAIDEDRLLTQLNSGDMDFFIRHASRDYRNGWKSYAKAFIKDFGIIVENQLL